MHKFSLVACARWESEHIYEWLSYHLCIGIDHIYLYCNDDDPKELYEKIAVFCRGDNPKVTFKHYPFVGEQWNMYVHFLENYKGATELACFLDVDEFITLKNNNSIKEYLSRFKGLEWDTILLNWVYFGNNNHETRPKGSVLENYTKRSRRISHITKVIVKTESISNEYVKSNPVPFWHGIGVGTYDVFNFNLKHLTATGESFPDFYEKWWSLYNENKESDELLRMEDSILNDTYISHFFLKSHADASRRIARGTGGNFSGQSAWASKVESKSDLVEYLKEFNAVEDIFLRNKWEQFHTPEEKDYYIPLPLGKNISEGCVCFQSSISPWSGDGADASSDAMRVVNMPANGLHKHHTEVEQSAWWMIDLGAIKNMNEIRIFHRKERNVEVKNFRIEISSDNKLWKVIFETQKDYRFGGVDGKPFIFRTHGEICRYVKISLSEFGAIHFDRVEIYQ
ncbi:discoidin domain-containing protein [Acetobacter sp.]|uniref:discoidin domain-containing protein n=1 Tax=Acetobacter sp. TaxID=440 RepID=UPI002590B274|nr:discoidin domain-containing protein [Acetobacter sp.]MCC6103547.1 glycosyltransferase family 2 protein [Acetobacter sp.]